MTWFGWRAAQPRANMTPVELVVASMADVLHRWEEAYFRPGAYVSGDGMATLTPRCPLAQDPSYVLHTVHQVSSEVRKMACEVIGMEIWTRPEIKANFEAYQDSLCDCGEARLIIHRSEGR